MEEKCKLVLDTLSQLVSIKTVSDPVKGDFVTLNNAREIKAALPRQGEEYELLTDAPSPILISKRGRGRPITLMLAHYDVVPPGPGWTRDPFKLTIEGDRAYGRGAADDKSNVAAISTALTGYKPDRGTLLIAFTGDEEIGGKSAKWLAQYLDSEGLWPDFLVNGDGSLSKVITRRRAGYTATVSVKEKLEYMHGIIHVLESKPRMARKTRHSAYFIPGVDTHPLIDLSLRLRDNDLYAIKLDGIWVKNNVIPGEARVTAVSLEGFDSVEVDIGLTGLLYALLPLSRAPISTDLYSDYGVNINPNVYMKLSEMHTIIIDIRAMTNNKNNIENILKDVLRESLENYGLHFDLKVKGGSGYLYTPSSSRLVQHALDINDKLGLSSHPVEAGGASDSRYFSPRGVEVIDYGPLGFQIHGPDEHVFVSHLCKAVKFYRMIADVIHGGVLQYDE